MQPGQIGTETESVTMKTRYAHKLCSPAEALGVGSLNNSFILANPSAIRAVTEYARTTVGQPGVQAREPAGGQAGWQAGGQTSGQAGVCC